MGIHKKIDLVGKQWFEVPIQFGSSKKNWAAVVTPSLVAPGGRDRKWLSKVDKGRRYSIQGVMVGDVIEFACDEKTAKPGRRFPNRFRRFFLVQRIEWAFFDGVLFDDWQSAQEGQAKFKAALAQASPSTPVQHPVDELKYQLKVATKALEKARQAGVSVFEEKERLRLATMIGDLSDIQIALSQNRVILASTPPPEISTPEEQNPGEEALADIQERSERSKFESKPTEAVKEDSFPTLDDLGLNEDINGEDDPPFDEEDNEAGTPLSPEDQEVASDDSEWGPNPVDDLDWPDDDDDGGEVDDDCPF